MTEAFGAVSTPKPAHRGRNGIIVAALVALWLVLDQATKVFFNQFPEGTVVFGPFGDFLCLRTCWALSPFW